MTRIQAAVITLAIGLAAGCSIGSGSAARSNRLSAVGSAPAAGMRSFPALPSPVQLSSQLATINSALWGPQLLSFRAVVESLAADLEIHRITRADLGRTLVWDAQQSGERYVTAARSDAPAEAIRVVLYAIDTTTYLPAAPLVEVGAIDLYPQNRSTGRLAAPTMRYVVSGANADSTRYADFTAVLGEPGCLCATVGGWVTDGTTRVDFTTRYSFDADGGLRFTAVARLAAQPATIHLEAVAEEAAVRSEARFKFQGDSVETRGLMIPTADETVEGAFAVAVNGRPFADGDVALTSVMGPQSRRLSTVETMTVRQLQALTYGLLFNIGMSTYFTFNCGCAP